MQLIEDFEAFREAGHLLAQRLEEFSAAVSRTPPMGDAEKVLLDHLKSLIDGASARLGSSRAATPTGGATGAIYLALTDLRKTPEFATAFAHIRRSKNLPEDFGDAHESGNGNVYSVPAPKALRQ